MAVYVFITSEFMPSADANGICVYNISKELIKEGNKVYVICEGANEGHRYYEDIEIYEVKPTLYKHLTKKVAIKKNRVEQLKKSLVLVLRRFRKLFVFFTYPNTAPERAKKEYTILEDIWKRQKFDYLIGTFRPYESLESISNFKTNYPEVKSVALFCDLLRTQNPFGNFFYKLYNSLCTRAENRILKVNDRILIPKSGKEFYDTDNFKAYKDKIDYFEFPVFTEEFKIDVISKKDTHNYVNVTCIGTIDGENRSANYFLNLFEAVKDKSNVELKINIVGSFYDITTYEEFKNKSYINFIGQVDYKDIPRFIASADYLVNISNKTTYDMIPSKIFQYFASCKPVINFVAHKDDKSLCYFEDYPRSLNILEYNHQTKDDAEKIYDFIFKNDNVKLSYEDVETIYNENKPSYFIENFLK